MKHMDTIRTLQQFGNSIVAGLTSKCCEGLTDERRVVLAAMDSLKLNAAALRVAITIIDLIAPGLYVMHRSPSKAMTVVEFVNLMKATVHRETTILLGEVMILARKFRASGTDLSDQDELMKASRFLGGDLASTSALAICVTGPAALSTESDEEVHQRIGIAGGLVTKIVAEAARSTIELSEHPGAASEAESNAFFNIIGLISASVESAMPEHFEAAMRTIRVVGKINIGGDTNTTGKIIH